MSPYARLAAAARAESAQADAAVQTCVSQVHDEQFQLRDRNTGQLLRCASYRIEHAGGVFEGVTDDEGMTERVNTGGRAEALQLFLLNELAQLVSDGAAEAPCCV